MLLTRHEHSCLVVEENDTRILVDVGSWTEDVPVFDSLAALLITHEHKDHFILETLQALRTAHPHLEVLTHPGMGRLLDEAGISYTSIEPGQTVLVGEVPITSYGTEHAIIYGTTSPCRNTGFLIAGRLFIPGDALHDIPPVPVEILALPTGGPWMKVAEAIDYANAVKPRSAFPIHDAMYTETYRQTSVPRWMNTNLTPGIDFINLQPGDSREF